jgi:3-phenylpropionate/trans-cinnamate dioxygenase ferredoxin component
MDKFQRDPTEIVRSDNWIMTVIKCGLVQDFEVHPLRVVESDGKKILLAKQGSAFFAIGDTCMHMGCSLSVGTLEGETVRCRCHGSVFNLRTGEVIRGPAIKPEPSWPVTVKNGEVFVDI